MNNISDQLRQRIIRHIEHQDLRDIIIKMGYTGSTKSRERGLQRLQNTLSSKELGLANGSYDYKYSNKEFIDALCRALGIKKANYAPQLQALDAHVRWVMNAQLPSVFADIAFKDNFVKSYMSMMAVGQFKYVKLDKHIRLQSREKQWHHICQAIRQHHANRQGKIPYDGVIKGYHICFNDSEGLRSEGFVKTDNWFIIKKNLIWRK